MKMNLIFGRISVIFILAIGIHTMVFAQSEIYYNKKPPRDTANFKFIEEPKTPCYLLLRVNHYSELYRLRNYCENHGKYVGYCYHEGRKIYFIREFSSKALANDFGREVIEREVAKVRHIMIIEKKKFEHSQPSCGLDGKIGKWGQFR